LGAFAESCRWAGELGCATVMSASDRGRGDLARAATSVREAAGIAAEHRVRLAIEFNSQAEQLNNLDVMRGIVSKADIRAHVHVGDPQVRLDEASGQVTVRVSLQKTPARVLP